jgi:hypothetical protein
MPSYHPTNDYGRLFGWISRDKVMLGQKPISLREFPELGRLLAFALQRPEPSSVDTSLTHELVFMRDKTSLTVPSCPSGTGADPVTATSRRITCVVRSIQQLFRFISLPHWTGGPFSLLLSVSASCHRCLVSWGVNDVCHVTVKSVVINNCCRPEPPRQAQASGASPGRVCRALRTGLCTKKNAMVAWQSGDLCFSADFFHCF